MQTNLAVAMMVRNESGRYLEAVLTQAKEYAGNNILIVDNDSEDDTPELAIKMGARVIRYPYPFHEQQIRYLAWEAASEFFRPRFIMVLDADELLFPRSIEVLEDIYNSQLEVIGGTWYHAFYAPHTVRVDGYWNSSYSHQPLMMRVNPQAEYTWNSSPLHGGRLNEQGMSMVPLNMLNILHLGYAHKDDIVKKHAYYLKHDPRGERVGLAHYNSIVATPSLMPLPYPFPGLEQLLATSSLWPNYSMPKQVASEHFKQ